MNSWINLDALWKIVLVGLLAGAGLPALFAVGIRALAVPAHPLRAVHEDHDGAAATAVADRAIGGNPAAIALAGLCFAVVLGAIGYGIYLIVSG